MDSNSQQVRKAIQREQAENYLLITLLSFAMTVSLTRLFLELTGYPQIGGGELHIAHVLWGGLFLFIAALLPIIYANRWVYPAGALLAGIGVGLFIDEVGKFITRTNDYFYPAAAPIIYTVFLLTVLVYLRLRRPARKDPRAELYQVFEDLEELLDQDLSKEERAHILKTLEKARNQKTRPDLANFAANLHEYLEHNIKNLAPESTPVWRRILNQLTSLEEVHFNRIRFKAALIGGLLAWSLWTLETPLRLLLGLRTPQRFELVLSELVQNQIVRNASGLNMFEARVGLEGSVGIIVFIAVILLIIGKERWAVTFAYLGLLLSLTIVGLLLFYFNQFETIINSVIQLLLLLAVIRYRNKYFRPPVS
jgi:hypothetical protein